MANTGFKRLPPVTDHSWARTSMPLLGFLQVPRTWPDLIGWSRREDLTRQCLAWLDGNGEIRSFYRDETIYWVSTKWSGGTYDPNEGRRTKRKRNNSHLNPVFPKPGHLPSPASVGLIPGSDPAILEPACDAIPLENVGDLSNTDSGTN